MTVDDLFHWCLWLLAVLIAGVIGHLAELLIEQEADHVEPE